MNKSTKASRFFDKWLALIINFLDQGENLYQVIYFYVKDITILGGVTMKYGLVFAGGGTRGAYHMGVWKAISELGIDICAVSGTSIGAVNGALFVQGDYERAYDLWRNITLGEIVALPESVENEDNLFNIKNAVKIAKQFHEKNGLSMKPLEKLLNEVIDEEKIRKSDIDFGFTAYSLTDKTEKQFEVKDIPKGEIVKYLMASVCLPGFRPRVIDGKKMIDGGIADNMPVDMLAKKGIYDIITVDVQGIGIYKSVNTAGMNIINIRNNEPSVGTMDFNSEGISESINKGYLDAKKAFGYYEGEIYSFEVSDYLLAKRSLSKSILNGLESAAKALGVKADRVYTVSEMAAVVIDKFEKYINNTKLDYDELILKGDSAKLIAFIVIHLSEDGGDFIKSRLGVLGKYYNAANAIMYFRQKNK